MAEADAAAQDSRPAPLAPAAARPGGRRTPQPLRWRLVELLSSYLPLVLMGVLAMGTWWLVKNTPLSDDPRVAAPLRHVPDYEMRHFALQRFTPQGQLRAQIEGDVLRHYPDTDTVEIDNVRLRAVGTDGRVLHATARQAISNGDATEVQLVGQAEILRDGIDGGPPIGFRSEFLHAFIDTERIKSHLPVTVTQGGTELRADSMEYSHLDRVIKFGGRMRAVFSPRESK